MGISIGTVLMMNLKFCELAVLVGMVLFGCILGKECTNIPTQLSSHTFRYDLLTSSNDSWRSEVYSLRAMFTSGDSIFPRKLLGERDDGLSWAMLKEGSIKATETRVAEIKEVSLHDVRLYQNSLHGLAQRTNLEYLLMLDMDRLVWSFRKTAGLPAIGDPYRGWEAPDIELRGHFVGHFLSASALMWASTRNDILKERMSAVVSALSSCQKKMGTGYLSAFPSEELDRFEQVRPVWAPYYTLHKIMAGLLDQYLFAFNDHALEMATWMADYIYERVQNVVKKFTIEQHYISLNEETGGMNDVLYRLFKITANEKHALLASFFDKPCFLGLLAVKADDISRFHANTHIPIVIGSQMRYEATGDSLHKEMGFFFMRIVNDSYTYATGGTSVSEFWTDPNRLATTLQTENEESCTTYNMLKVSRNLFKWTGDASYAEYYERALTNGVLSIQRGTEPGIMIYMLPLGRGVSKAESHHGWGTPFNTFWCCYGTAIESFSKLGDSIYFYEEGEQPTVYIIQYISSTLDSRSAGILINQTVDDIFSWDPYLRVTLTFSLKGEADMLVKLRIPTWSSMEHSSAKINGRNLSLPLPGNFLPVSVDPNDTVTLKLRMGLRIEPIKDDRPEFASLHAILFGNYLLVGLTYSKRDANISADPSAPVSEWVTPIDPDYNLHLFSLIQNSGNSSFVFSKSNRSIMLQKFPEPGTATALNATFRLILKNDDPSKFSSPGDAIGNVVLLEPFDLPTKLVAYQSENHSLLIADSSAENVRFDFRLVDGLDGRNATVSLKAEVSEGCYAVAEYGSLNDVKLGCSQEPYSDHFKQMASFVMREGLRKYHPLCFVAKGSEQNFILEPLLSLRDEHYTTYFNVKP